MYIMKVKVELVLSALLVLLVIFKPVFLSDLTGSILGKLLLAGAVVYVAKMYGRNAGILTALVAVLLMHTQVEGFSQDEIMEKVNEVMGGEDAEEGEEDKEEDEDAEEDEEPKEEDAEDKEERPSAEEAEKEAEPATDAAPKDDTEELVEGFTNVGANVIDLSTQMERMAYVDSYRLHRADCPY